MSRKLHADLRRGALRYGVAIGSVALLATVDQLFVWPHLGNQFPFLLVYPAVFCAAWYGGFGPGLLATVLAVLATDYFVFEPRFSFGITSRAQQIGTALFLIFGGSISWLGESLLRASHRLEQYARDLAGQRDVVKKQAEADVRLLSSLIDQAHDAILIRQPGGTISYWNRGAERIYGLSREQALGRVSQELLKTRFPRPLAEIEAEVMRQGSWEGELVHTRSDGECIAVSSRWVADRAAPGEPMLVLEINSDITERKQADEALRTSEKRYRSLVEATAAIVWHSPPSGEIDADHPLWTAFTGQTFEQFKGSGWLDAVHPDDRESTRRLWSLATKNLTLYEAEHRLRDREGRYHDMLVRGVPILADDGTILEWVGLHHDITARKRAEAEVRLLSSLIDQAHDAILIRQAGGTISYWNRGAERVYGCAQRAGFGARFAGAAEDTVSPTARGN